MADYITADEAGGTDVTYYEVTPSTQGTREFRTTDVSSDMRRIVHSAVYRKSPSTGVDRRRFYISKNVTDSGTGVIHTASISCELVLPPTGSLTLTHVKDLVSALVAVLARNSSGVVDYGNVASIIAGLCPTGDLAA